MPATTQEILAGRDVIYYTEPFAAGNTFPADSVVWGSSPGGSWVDSGYTKDGVHVNWRQQIQDYTIDQFVDPVLRLPLSRDLRFQANIGQVDMPDLAVATGQGSASSLAASTGVRGHNDFVLSANVSNNYYSVLFDCRNPITNESGRFLGWFARGVGDLNITVHLPDIAQVNVELACQPDVTTTPARIAQFRMVTPAA
jgi:hypothetical protein